MDGNWRTSISALVLAPRVAVHRRTTLSTEIYKHYFYYHQLDFPGGISGKEPTCQCRRREGSLGLIPGFDPWVRKIPWRGAGQLTPVFLLGESHGQTESGRVQSMKLQKVGYNLAR